MHVGAILQETTIDRLDKDVFLASILKKDRSWLFAHNEAILSDVQVEQVFEYIKRREAGEPVAYILGEKEFYGRNFSVNEHTLIPRPSTEGLIEMVLKNEKYKKLDTEVIGVFVSFNKPSPLIPLPRGEGSLIVDIGTGSGCIAITLAKEIPNIKIIATDISKDA
jgi:release factor glutamine methyltransferase